MLEATPVCARRLIGCRTDHVNSDYSVLSFDATRCVIILTGICACVDT